MDRDYSGFQFKSLLSAFKKPEDKIVDDKKPIIKMVTILSSINNNFSNMFNNVKTSSANRINSLKEMASEKANSFKQDIYDQAVNTKDDLKDDIKKMALMTAALALPSIIKGFNDSSIPFIESVRNLSKDLGIEKTGMIIGGGIATAGAGLLGLNAFKDAKGSMDKKYVRKNPLTGDELKILKSQGYKKSAKGFTDAEGKFLSKSEAIMKFRLSGLATSTGKKMFGETLKKTVGKFGGASLIFESIDYITGSKKFSKSNIAISAGGILGAILGGALGSALGPLGGFAGAIGGDLIGRKLVTGFISAFSHLGLKLNSMKPMLEGATKGAVFGSALGPAGTVIGGITGGILGAIGGIKSADVKNIGSYANLNGVNFSGLRPPVQQRFAAMAKEWFDRTGKKINVKSAFRSKEQQAALYRKYGPGRAAPPGNSRHEMGLALDISSADANALASAGLLNKYGFIRPVRGEAWHIEPNESRGRGAPAIADSPEDKNESAPKSAPTVTTSTKKTAHKKIYTVPTSKVLSESGYNQTSMKDKTSFENVSNTFYPPPVTQNSPNVKVINKTTNNKKGGNNNIPSPVYNKYDNLLRAN